MLFVFCRDENSSNIFLTHMSMRVSMGIHGKLWYSMDKYECVLVYGRLWI